MDVSRALEDGVLSEKAYEDGAREVVVMPSLSGPVSLVLGVRLLLLDREDYDDETLDAIFRHELVDVLEDLLLLVAGPWHNAASFFF